MPKRRQRAILSYEQSFCLDLNSYWNHSTGAEHSVCCFTDYTKLYVCAHRVFLLHDLRQDLLCYCPQFPGDGLLLWTGLQNQLAELGEQADPAGMVSTAPRSHGTENLFVPVKCAFIRSLQYSAQGWEEGSVCSASTSAAEWSYYLHLPQIPHVQDGYLMESALRLGGKLYCN